MPSPSSLLLSLLNVPALQPLLQPLSQLILDLTTALLLLITFVVQSLSILISLDATFAALYHALSQSLTSYLTPFAVWLSSNMERKAVCDALVSFLFNLIWVQAMYQVETQLWLRFIFVQAPIHILVLVTLSWIIARVQLDPTHRILKRWLQTFLVGSIGLLGATISRTPQQNAGIIVLLLRPSIDAICRGMDCLLASDIEGQVVSSQHMLEVSRSMFWTSIGLHQLMVRQRQARIRFLLLLCHDIIALGIPTRKMFRQIRLDRFVTERFPRITSEELARQHGDTCAICLCAHNDQSVKLACGHFLHAHCLSRVLQQGSSLQPSRCPMCRAHLPQPEQRNSNLQLMQRMGLGQNETSEEEYQVQNVLQVRILRPRAHGTGTILNISSGQERDTTARPSRVLFRINPRSQSNNNNGNIISQGNQSNNTNIGLTGGGRQYMRVNMQNRDIRETTLESFLTNAANHNIGESASSTTVPGINHRNNLNDATTVPTLQSAHISVSESNHTLESTALPSNSLQPEVLNDESMITDILSRSVSETLMDAIADILEESEQENENNEDGTEMIEMQLDDENASSSSSSSSSSSQESNLSSRVTLDTMQEEESLCGEANFEEDENDNHDTLIGRKRRNANNDIDQEDSESNEDVEQNKRPRLQLESEK
jgi:hypothetical protein